MKPKKPVDSDEYWKEAQIIRAKIAAFNNEVTHKIKSLLSQDWEDIDPDTHAYSPYQTEGKKKFTGACFWFLFMMLYDRHLNHTEWSHVFDFLEEQVLNPVNKTPPKPLTIQAKNEWFSGKQPAKRAKSISRKLEQSTRGIYFSREAPQRLCDYLRHSPYTLSEDIALYQLRLRVTRLPILSKQEPSSSPDYKHEPSSKQSKCEEETNDRQTGSGRKLTSQLITQFYPPKVVSLNKDDTKQPHLQLFVSPVKLESSNCTGNSGFDRGNKYLGVEVQSSHRDVRIDRLIEELQKEHCDTQDLIRKQLKVLRMTTLRECNNNIGKHMTLDPQDMEAKNTAGIIGKLPGPSGLIFQNCYHHISLEDEKVFRAVRLFAIRSAKKKSKLKKAADVNKLQQDVMIPIQPPIMHQPSGSSRTIREFPVKARKSKGSQNSPQTLPQQLVSVSQPRSNFLLDDDKCQVCGDGDYTDTNLIVYCAKCNICTHQLCFGLETIPKGNWVCDLCRYYGTVGFGMKCPLCPKTGGLMRRCNLPSTHSHWRQFSLEYYNYMRSGSLDPPQEPPTIVSEDILLFEKQSIQGDYAAFLFYDYFGKLALGERPPDSPRPHLAWIHLCCLPSHTDLKPFTNADSSDLKRQGHLTSPIELPSIFPINHKVPLLYREVQLVGEDSKTTSAESGPGPRRTLLATQVVTLPNLLEIEAGINGTRGSTSSRIPGTSRSTKQTSRIETSQDEKPSSVLQSPNHKVVLHSPQLQDVKANRSRQRNLSKNSQCSSRNLSLRRPARDSLSIQRKLEDAQQPTLEAYRPEWTDLHPDKVLLDLRNINQSPTHKREELLNKYALPCTCCRSAIGFLFSCPKCNRATHGSCGVLAGSKRIGDRITCREHTEDEIFTLLKNCQEKNKSEILAWLDLEDYNVPIEKGLRDLRTIAHEVKQLDQEQRGSVEDRMEEISKPKIHWRTKRRILNQIVKASGHQICILLNKLNPAGDPNQYSATIPGLHKSTGYVVADVLVNSESILKLGLSDSAGLASGGQQRIKNNSFASERVIYHPQIDTRLTNLQNPSSNGFGPPGLVLSPLSFNELAAQSTKVVPNTCFRLSQVNDSLTLAEQPPNRRGEDWVTVCKQEADSRFVSAEPQDTNLSQDHSQILKSVNRFDEEVLGPPLISPESDPDLTVIPPLGLVTSPTYSRKGSFFKVEPKLESDPVLPIPPEVKLKIETTLKLAPALDPPVLEMTGVAQCTRTHPEHKPMSLAEGRGESPPKHLAIQILPNLSVLPVELEPKTAFSEPVPGKLLTYQFLKRRLPKAFARPLMKASLYGAQHKDSFILFSACIRPRKRKEPTGRLREENRQQQKDPVEPELDPRMLGKRMILIPRINTDLKIKEPVSGTISLSSLYDQTSKTVHNPVIRTAQKVPIMLDTQPVMGTPPRYCVSLSENKDILQPSAKEWEGFFNSYLKAREEEEAKKSRAPKLLLAGSKPISRRILTTVTMQTRGSRTRSLKHTNTKTRSKNPRAHN